MKNNSKHFWVFAGLAAAGLVLFFLSETSAANAALPGLNINIDTKSFNLDFLPSFISGPINYLINLGKQLEAEFAREITRVNIGSFGLNNTLSGLNDWFWRTTGGISLFQALGFLGNALASIFSFFADMIRKGVSVL